MDKTDKIITDLLKSNARMSYQELGDKLGMSRVAAKKRVMKLERDGVIRGYNTYIYREDEIILLIDIVTVPGRFESVLDYLATRTVDVRQIYSTRKENHIHMVAVSDDSANLKYMINIIQKTLGDDIAEFHCHQVKDIIKDVYGGIKYEQRSEFDNDGVDKRD